MIRKLLAISAAWLLLSSPPLWGQRDTELIVIQYVFDQVIVAAPSDPIRNAGQTQHSLFIRFEDRPTLTCTDTGLDIQLEQGIAYGDDPGTVVWTDFGEAVTATEYGTVGTTYRTNTSGAVQFLRVDAEAFDTTNCFLSVTYVGSTRPVPLFDIGGDTNIVHATYYFFNPVLADPPCGVGEYFLFYNVTDMALRICENGVISDVGGGGGGGDTRIVLNMTDAIALDGTTNNSTADFSVEKAAATGVDAFWLEGVYANGQQLMWNFIVPANFASAPVLTMYGLGSTAIGTYNFGSQVRCLTPDNSEDWTTKAFATINSLTGQAFTGAGHLETLTIPLTNSDSMAAGDLCTIIFSQNSTGFVLQLLAGVITYTGL